jgi:hypothetical protein
MRKQFPIVAGDAAQSIGSVLGARPSPADSVDSANWWRATPDEDEYYESFAEVVWI